MNEELQLNSYVLLGNALLYLRNQPSSGLDVDTETIADLNRKIEPLRPNQIPEGIASLRPEEKLALLRCCRYCVQVLGEDESAAVLGLPPEVAEEVLLQLGLG